MVQKCRPAHRLLVSSDVRFHDMKNNRTVSWRLRKAARVAAQLPTKSSYSRNCHPSCIWRRSHSVWVLVSLFPGTAKAPPQDRPHRCMYRHQENTQVVVRCLLALPLLLVANIHLTFNDETALVTDDSLPNPSLSNCAATSANQQYDLSKASDCIGTAKIQSKCPWHVCDCCC